LLHWRVLGVLDVGLHRVGPVGGMTAAIAAGESLEEGVVLAAARVGAAEADMADHAFRSGGHLLRHRLRQGLEQHLAQAGGAAHPPTMAPGWRALTIEPSGASTRIGL